MDAEQGSNAAVYTLSVRSLGLLTGDWALSRSIGFYLSEKGDARFEMRYARDASDLLQRAVEDRFWIAYIELPRTNSQATVQTLADNGFDVGRPIIVGEGDRRVVLRPVHRTQTVSTVSGRTPS